MIIAESLVKRFGGQTVVDQVSFEIRQGEVIGLLGPNGAGKSTTMRLLAGCLEPDAGSALIQGHNSARDRRKAQACLGYLAEGAPSYPAMTPRGFVRFHLRARGFNGQYLDQACETALIKANVGPTKDRRIGQLSKGYKRRAALAAAIAHDPDVLILDEPTDGLDPNQKDGVRDMIRDMASTKAIIISTHLLEDVMSLCTRTLLIHDGRIKVDLPPIELANLSEDKTIAASFRQLTKSSSPDDQIEAEQA